MAIRQYCDRCPKEIPEYKSTNNRIGVPTMKIDLSISKHVKMVKAGLHLTYVDLCDECMGKLKEFLGLDKIERIADEN